MGVLNLNRATIVAAAVSALFVGDAAAQTTPTFKISIGVRETGSTAGIGEPSAPSNAGGIEWINKDVQTLVADGTWQKFEFNFGTDSVTNFASGNGVLNGTRGTLEHIRFLNTSGTTSQITMLIDDVVNTVGGTDVVLNDFEANTVNQFVSFQSATNSSAAMVTAGSTAKVIDTAAHAGTKSYEEKWRFIDADPTRWIRFSTSTSGGLQKPNPTIDFTSGNKLSLWLSATVPVEILGWNSDSDGNWSDASRWAGPAADNTPNTLSELARFLPTTAPRTVTVDADFTVNGLNLNSPNAYTIAGTNRLILNANATLGLDSSLVVQAGNHVVTAPLEARARVTVSISAGASLKTGGIEAKDAAGTADAHETVSITKSGAGTYETGFLRFNAATLNAGTLKLAPNGTATGTSELNTLVIAGGTTPTAKLDITNNALIIDWDDSTAGARPDPKATIRARIINGFNAGTWDGNGITSSTAAADPRYAIGYGDAATLGITEFVGRAVDTQATLVRLTFGGDADLNGTVGFTDLVTLAQNYDANHDPAGPAGPKVWSQGDFDYDGITAFADLVKLAQNYNQSLTPAQAALLGADFATDFALAQAIAVPEPTTLAAVGALSTMMLRRRRSAR